MSVLLVILSMCSNYLGQILSATMFPQIKNLSHSSECGHVVKIEYLNLSEPERFGAEGKGVQQDLLSCAQMLAP